MTRSDYYDFHSLMVDAEKRDGLFVYPSIRKSGLMDLYFHCCKQSNEHPNKIIVLEIEFYCDDPERLDDGL